MSGLETQTNKNEDQVSSDKVQETLATLEALDELTDEHRGYVEKTIPTVLKSGDTEQVEKAISFLEGLAIKYLGHEIQEDTEEDTESVVGPRSLSAASPEDESDKTDKVVDVVEGTPEISGTEPSWQEIIMTPEGQEHAETVVEELRSRLVANVIAEFGSKKEGEHILKPIQKEIKAFNRELERWVSIPTENRRADSVEAFRASRKYIRVTNSMDALIRAFEEGRIKAEKSTKSATEDNKVISDQVKEELAEDSRTVSDEVNEESVVDGAEVKRVKEGMVDLENSHLSFGEMMEDEITAQEEGYKQQTVRHDKGPAKNAHYEDHWSKIGSNRPEKNKKSFKNREKATSSKRKELSPEEAGQKLESIVTKLNDPVLSGLYKEDEQALYGKGEKAKDYGVIRNNILSAIAKVLKQSISSETSVERLSGGIFGSHVDKAYRKYIVARQAVGEMWSRKKDKNEFIPQDEYDDIHENLNEAISALLTAAKNALLEAAAKGEGEKPKKKTKVNKRNNVTKKSAKGGRSEGVEEGNTEDSSSNPFADIFS